jgi:ketosteroid isomerase-like protein
VELVCRVNDLFNAREVEQALDLVGDDFEMDWTNSIGPLKGVYRGRPGVLELWTSFLDAWESVRWDPQEIIEVDEERLILINHVRMRGRGSGVEVDATAAQLWTFTDGKARQIKLYQSKAEAFEAAGLSEKAMSQENVEIVRQLAEAVQRGVDDDDPGAIFDTGLLADDAEWVLPRPFEGKSVWRGRREYAEWMRAWTGEFEDFSIRFEPLIDAGDDRVVAISHQHATGKGSGVPVEWRGGWVIELRDGRAIRSTHYLEPAQALEAAGLSE